MECASKPRTIRFYESKLAHILQSELVDCHLEQIDAYKVEAYKRTRTVQASRRKKPVSPRR
jgi:hypothetical protein